MSSASSCRVSIVVVMPGMVDATVVTDIDGITFLIDRNGLGCGGDYSKRTRHLVTQL